MVRTKVDGMDENKKGHPIWVAYLFLKKEILTSAFRLAWPDRSRLSQ
jgi:hypothetical protein